MDRGPAALTHSERRKHQLPNPRAYSAPNLKYVTIAGLPDNEVWQIAGDAVKAALSFSRAGANREYVVLGGWYVKLDAFLFNLADRYPTAELIVDTETERV